MIVDANSPYNNQVLDVLVVEDTISIIGEDLSSNDVQVIDLQGAVLTTGWAELHSDLGEPGREEAETLKTGSAAAALGGFTSVGVVSGHAPHIQDKTGVEYLLRQSEELPVHLVPVGTASKDAQGNSLSELYEMSTLGSTLFGDYKTALVNANLMKLALLYTKPFGRILAHPANASLNGSGVMHEGATSTYIGLKGMPEIAEEVQIARDLALAEYTGGALHIAGVSTLEGLSLLANAKAKGINVTASVAMHQLLFTDEIVSDYNSHYKVNPPLRTEAEQSALIDALDDGTIDCLAVDHLPHDIEAKACEFDNAAFGMASFEGAVAHLMDRLPEASSEQWQQWLSTTPRTLLGLEPLKIIEGMPAEFTVYNKDGQEWTGFASKAYNNPFKGSTTTTRVVGTFCKGTWRSIH